MKGLSLADFTLLVLYLSVKNKQTNKQTNRYLRIDRHGPDDKRLAFLKTKNRFTVKKNMYFSKGIKVAP